MHGLWKLSLIRVHELERQKETHCHESQRGSGARRAFTLPSVSTLCWLYFSWSYDLSWEAVLKIEKTMCLNTLH